jgi:hypothetical protein
MTCLPFYLAGRVGLIMFLIIISAIFLPFQVQAITVTPNEEGVVVDGLEDGSRTIAILQGVATDPGVEGTLMDVEVVVPVNLSASRMTISLTNVAWVRCAIIVGDQTYAMVRSSQSGNVWMVGSVPKLDMGSYHCVLSAIPRKEGPIAFQVVTRGGKRSGVSSFTYPWPTISGSVQACLLSISMNNNLTFQKRLI